MTEIFGFQPKLIVILSNPKQLVYLLKLNERGSFEVPSRDGPRRVTYDMHSSSVTTKPQKMKLPILPISRYLMYRMWFSIIPKKISFQKASGNRQKERCIFIMIKWRKSRSFNNCATKIDSYITHHVVLDIGNIWMLYLFTSNWRFIS